jgi:hypothetical protein
MKKFDEFVNEEKAKTNFEIESELADELNKNVRLIIEAFELKDFHYKFKAQTALIDTIMMEFYVGITQLSMSGAGWVFKRQLKQLNEDLVPINEIKDKLGLYRDWTFPMDTSNVRVSSLKQGQVTKLVQYSLTRQESRKILEKAKNIQSSKKGIDKYDL